MKRENRKDVTLGRGADNASYAQRTVKDRLKESPKAKLNKPKLSLGNLKKDPKVMGDRFKEMFGEEIEIEAPTKLTLKSKKSRGKEKTTLTLKRKRENTEEEYETEESADQRKPNFRGQKKTTQSLNETDIEEKEYVEEYEESDKELENEGEFEVDVSNRNQRGGLRDNSSIQNSDSDLGYPDAPLLKGRKKTFLPVAAPPRACDVCRFSLTCPEFKQGAECFFLPVFNQWTIDTPFDIKEALLAMAELEVRRAQEAVIEEQLSGGVGTGVASDMLAKAKQSLIDAHSMFAPRENPHSGPSVIAQLFGIIPQQITVADADSRSRKQIEVADHVEYPVYKKDNEKKVIIDSDTATLSQEKGQEGGIVPETAKIAQNGSKGPSQRFSELKPDTIKENSDSSSPILGISYTEEERALLQDSTQLTRNAELQAKLEAEEIRRAEAELKNHKLQQEKKELPEALTGSVRK